jgi:hypothetical protein
MRELRSLSKKYTCENSPDGARYFENAVAIAASSTDLPAPVGPMMQVWPTSP